ncbi:Protein-tyrosine-phosphatase [Nymphaea thermarum]|nr:Protein-tyrosine-phosphatase [Nymphaea thermarum]
MVGDGTDSGGSRRQCQVSGGQKPFWRSASWSERSTPPLPCNNGNPITNPFDPERSINPFRGFPAPLTPRSQQNLKARSCLPPLQPLAINRRNLEDWPKAGSDDTGDWLQPPTPGGRKEVGKPSEGLTLDLGSFEENLVSSGSHIRKERISYFDKECSKVADHIYLGGDAVAKNREILRQHGITHVLNCVGFVCPEYFKSDLVYKTLWLHDSPSEDITSILYDVFDYFEDVREQGGRVLVHCCQGVSRSTSLVIAYLMWREGQSFDDAFQYVKAARGITNPNMGFACQLLQCQKRVHAVPLSPSSMVRMYRMAPHSPYDPLHLVPKLLSEPSVTALDSRGAFIVNIPSAIYVWIGRKCEAVMARDAKAAAFQVVRYERAQGPVIAIEEGDEPTEFWDAFSKGVLCGENSGTVMEVRKHHIEMATDVSVGLKKVDSYNLDFEIFQRALTGGVVPPFSLSGIGLETHLPARENGWSILRRKFVSGDVKEWVSCSRVMPSVTVSLKNVGTSIDTSRFPWSEKLSSTSSSSSSSSLSTSGLKPPPLNLFSVSLASSVNENLNSSESPFSPSISANSSVASPASLIWPNTVSSSPSKGSFPSLAQRRGNMSRSLTLPAFRKGFTVLGNASSSACTSTSIGMMEMDKHNGEQPSDSKQYGSNEDRETSVKYQRHVSLGEVASAGLCPKTGSLTRSNCSDKESSDIVALDITFPQAPGLVHPIVYQWPNLKQINPLGLDAANYKGVLMILIPVSVSLDRQKVKALNLWVGSQWEIDYKWLNGGSRKQETEMIDWHQVGTEFLTKMGLPTDLLVQVVKEEDRPEGFCHWLNSLVDKEIQRTN